MGLWPHHLPLAGTRLRRFQPAGGAVRLAYVPSLPGEAGSVLHEDVQGDRGHERGQPGPARRPRRALDGQQHGALFPWKTLLDNVAYGPIVQGKMKKSEAKDKASVLLDEAGISDMMNNYPGEVSSGMARRAEIVRALINDPKVLLLDEPYRAMDALTKSIMHESLLEVYDKTKVTIFFITHDLEEAIFLGDRVVVMTTRPAKTKIIVDVNIPP